MCLSPLDLIAASIALLVSLEQGWGEGSEDMSDLAGKMLASNGMYVLSSTKVPAPRMRTGNLPSLLVLFSVFPSLFNTPPFPTM